MHMVIESKNSILHHFYANNIFGMNFLKLWQNRWKKEKTFYKRDSK
jgi:hypothetical protein